MKRTPRETALLIALLLKRSKHTRGRLSHTTIRILSGRSHLRAAFLEMVHAEVDDLGIHLLELERGGFGVIRISTLDGARAITAKKYLSPEEREKPNFNKINKEIQEDGDEGTGEEEGE